MTEAVRTKSLHIVLGATFTDWMRRMGFRTISHGPRGSATLIKEQLDRLLASEWMIRWESGDHHGEREFGIKEIKLTNEYVGSDRRNGADMSRFLTAVSSLGQDCALATTRALANDVQRG